MHALHEKLTSFEWSKRVKDEIMSSIDYHPSNGSLDRPGLELQLENVTGVSPVVLIPGFSSTGLEIWAGPDCSRAYFRQRMWGTARMVQQFMLNQKCWLESMMLNRATGLDPEGIKLRPASGLEAADYIIGGFWVWGKIIENLADIGYDSNNMYMAAYDWRLAPELLEIRDKYFTKLKYTIEMAKATNDGHKVMLVTHSYATQVIYYFMQWVESEQGGKGGPSWVDDNIEAFANIAGPTLGTIKSISALLSGEMKDTAELGGLSKVLGFFFSPASRALLARSWPSVFTMLPFGGDAIWGNATFAPDDIASRFPTRDEETGLTYNASQIPQHVAEHGSNGALLQFANNSHANLTAGELLDFLGAQDANLHHFDGLMSRSPVADDLASAAYDAPKYWTNPLSSTLPRAPNLKLFCLYGVGKPVERGYMYHANDPENEEIVDGHRVVPFMLDIDFDAAPFISNGVRYVDGDGTVPLISLGYMCAHGWRGRTKYNPGGVQVRVREYKHNPVSILYDPRGGPATSDHVDIMGNHDLIRDLLRISARQYEYVHENITSDILEIASRVELDVAI